MAGTEYPRRAHAAIILGTCEGHQISSRCGENPHWKQVAYQLSS